MRVCQLKKDQLWISTFSDWFGWGQLGIARDLPASPVKKFDHLGTTGGA
jgi:hypothetical protein